MFIPSACGGEGSCGFCTVVITDGGESVLPTETIFLTHKEIKLNVILACQVKIKQNIELSISEDLLNVKEFKVTVCKVVQPTHDIKEVNFILSE